MSEESATTLSDSLITESEESGLIGEHSSLDLRNLTVVENGSVGISLDNSADTSLQNSLVAHNAQGDLSGFSDVQVNFSWIGDGQFANKKGILSGDPLLENDYSLNWKSPAIDRGNNDEVLAKFDLRSHKRIVDGDALSGATVDLGAFEFGSDFSDSLILPVLKGNLTDFVSIALTNPAKSGDKSNQLSEVVLKAYLPNGVLHGTQILPIPAGTQTANFIVDFFPNLDKGWIEIYPDDPYLVGFTTVGKTNWEVLDGVPISGAIGERFIFPEIRSNDLDTTLFSIINPTAKTTQVFFEWNSPNGSISKQSRWISGKGMLDITFKELFGEGDSGYVTVYSANGTELHGVEIFGSDRSISGLSGISNESASAELTGAQLATGSNIDTFINIINLEQNGKLTLEAIQEDGKIASTVSFNLKANEQLRVSAKEVFGLNYGSFVGWLRASSNLNNLIGVIVFEDSRGRFSASLPMQNMGAREFVFSHVAQSKDIYTGITLLNPTSKTALFSLEVFNNKGQKVGYTLREIKPFHKNALLLSEWIPQIQTQMGGFVRIRSNVALQGFELFGTQEYLSAVPRLIVVE
jgi:hypothetical protein